MVAWLLMLVQDGGSLVAAAQRTLSVEPRCRSEGAGDDVVVCARRRADRYRLPLVVHAAGDPLWERAPAERARLLHRTTPVQDLGPFLVGGGMAGIHATVGAGGTRIATLRPLAP